MDPSPRSPRAPGWQAKHSHNHLLAVRRPISAVGVTTLVGILCIAITNLRDLTLVSDRQKMLAQCAATVKRFVYILRNDQRPPRFDTGVTSDPPTRLAEHNRGSCTHTAKYASWSIDVVIEFADERRAVALSTI